MEVLPPARARAVPDVQAMFDSLFEKKIAQLMGKRSNTLFQPYFQSRDVAVGIRKNQTVSEQRKWSRYFKKWGCDVCGTKECAHSAMGRCSACYKRTRDRLNEILASAASERISIPVFVDRQGDLARAALVPPAPLPPEKLMDLHGIAREALGTAQKALPAKSRKHAGRS